VQRAVNFLLSWCMLVLAGPGQLGCCMAGTGDAGDVPMLRTESALVIYLGSSVKGRTPKLNTSLLDALSTRRGGGIVDS
jgi:hypothetical protein